MSEFYSKRFSNPKQQDWRPVSTGQGADNKASPGGHGYLQGGKAKREGKGIRKGKGKGKGKWRAHPHSFSPTFMEDRQKDASGSTPDGGAPKHLLEKSVHSPPDGLPVKMAAPPPFKAPPRGPPPNSGPPLLPTPRPQHIPPPKQVADPRQGEDRRSLPTPTSFEESHPTAYDPCSFHTLSPSARGDPGHCGSIFQRAYKHKYPLSIDHLIDQERQPEELPPLSYSG